MANYWLKEHDKADPIGPYGGNLIKSFAAEKRIGPDWFISSDQKSWQRAGSVKGLFTEAPAPTSKASAPKDGPAIAAVLLEGMQFPIEALLAQMQQNPIPGQTAPEIDRGNMIFNVGDAIVAVAPMPAPYPARDLAGPCATAWMWPKGTSAMSVKEHRSHVLVTVIGGTLAPIPRRLLLTRVTTMAAQQPGVMGVYWCEGTLVHHPKIFIEMGTQINSPEAPPLYLWVDYRIERNTDRSFRLFTTGLEPIGMMEIEIPSITMNPAELRDWAINITYYLIKNGPVLKHGNTIGIDAKHQMRIAHAPSMFARPSKNPVIRIEGPKG